VQNRKVDPNMWDAKRGRVKTRANEADEVKAHMDMFKTKAYPPNPYVIIFNVQF
jgi:hypothetical protein